MNGMENSLLDQCNDHSGSYNGRRAVSETDNEGPIPSPGAQCLNTGKISLNGLHTARYVSVQLPIS
jgi:hypothetical protein